MKPRAKCPKCGFDSMSACRCGIPSLSNERNTMNTQDENKTDNEGMRAVGDKVPDITGLYKTERPSVVTHITIGSIFDDKAIFPDGNPCLELT